MVGQVITDSAQVSREWLQAALTRSGSLTSGQVSGFTSAPLKSDWSRIVSIKVDYSPDAAGRRPDRLLLKMCGGQNSHEFGPSEVDYYTRDYPHLSGPPLVRCYDAVYSAAEQSYHLLLDDLSATHDNNWERVANPEYAAGAVDGLAALHTAWWGAERLAGRLPDQPELARYFAHINPGLQPLLADLALEEGLDPAWPGLISEVGRRLPARLQARTGDPNGFTLVHGDVNPGNILSPLQGAGPVYLVDRQPFDWSLTVWLGASDLAYMMALWWAPPTRRRLEFSLLRRYHDRLLELGVKDYAWERLVEDYKLSVAQCIYGPVEWCALESDRLRMRWLWRSQLERVLAAVIDLDCLALL